MNGLANVLYLPLCPVSQEKLPAEEDWHEYGIDLSRSLKTLSEWIEDQIQSLTPKIAILAQSYPKEQEENVNKKKQPNKWSTLQEASHVLVPMGDLTWWSKTLENLSPLVESSKKPKAPKPVTLRTSTFDHNNQFFGQDPEEVTTIPAPESDLITRLLYGHQTRMAPKSTKAPVHEISESEEDSESTPFKLILRPLQAVRGPESVLNLTLLHHLLHMINLYYLDCVAIGGSKWTSVWTHSDQKSRMSFQSMVFLEIMHLRILRQIYCELYIPPETEEEPTNRFVVSSKYKFTKPPTDQQLYHEKHDPDMTTPFRFSECGAAYRQLCLTSKQFPWIFEKRLALERYIPVAAYTQSELEQTLTNLFFKFVRIEWHHELHHAINVIMDRLAVLFYNAQTEQVMNIEGLRTPISIETQEQIHQLQGSSNAPSTRQVLYSYNYDFLYRCSWRYYYAIQNILGFEQLIREPIPLFVPSIPKQELLYPSNLVQMQLYTRKQVTDLAAHIKQWLVGQFGTYSVGEYNTINEQIRRQVLDTVVPQGDTEWVKFKYPIIALNPNNIMEKIHSKFYMAIKQEVFPLENYDVLTKYLEASNPSNPLHFIFLRLVLFLVDKHFVADMESLRFKTLYVIPQRDIHLYAQLLYNSQEPYIRQWMGQYYVFFNNSISTMASNIFEVIAEWVLVVQYFCPNLWKTMQSYGETILPQQLLQTTINQFTLDMLPLRGEPTDAMDIDGDDLAAKAVTVKKTRVVPIVL